MLRGGSDIKKKVAICFNDISNKITIIKTQMEPILELQSQITAGFSSLDRRLPMMCDMINRYREDRLPQQKKKDKRNQLPYSKPRNQ
jgi:hypothetical protein